MSHSDHAPRRRTGVVTIALLFCVVLLTALPNAPAEEGPSIAELEARLIDARSARDVEAALDGLALRMPDPARLADWLGNLPEEAARHPRVLLRRGWGYVTTGRARDAVAPLERCLERDGYWTGPASAYLAEARRQLGAHTRCIDLLVAAARAGYRDEFVTETAHKAAFEMRSPANSRQADGVPAYAEALGRVAAVHPAPLLEAAAARWLLDDLTAFASVSPEARNRRWAAFAAQMAGSALSADPGLGGGTQLAFDAAEALREETQAADGRTARFDLLAIAYRLGRRPADDSHEIPTVVVRLAEEALREQRYDLAARLARERLDISDSPAARRVLDALPPDIGE